MLQARTQVIGGVIRAAAACDRPLGPAAQDQAARLETAVLAVAHAEGGVAGRDAFLDAVRPPPAPTQRARAAWCARQRADLLGIERFLTSAGGAALTAEAEAAARAAR